MAELLIFNRDNQHADPEKERRGCHKSGDIIVIAPDGWAWGYYERLPAEQGGKFRLVKVPGVSRDYLERLVQRQFNVQPMADLSKPGHPTIRRKRLRCDAVHGAVLSMADFLASIVDKSRESV